MPELVPIHQSDYVKLQGDDKDQSWYVEEPCFLDHIVLENSNPQAFHQKACGTEESLYNDGFRGYKF